MKRWLLSFVCAAFLAFGLSGNASADNANIASASAWCFGLESGAGGAIISPLVQCFTDTGSGIIPLVTLDFLSGAKNDYLPTIGVMFLLAIAWFGLKLFLGQVERIKGETLLLAFKMAGIMLFLDQAPWLYIQLISIMQQLSANVSQIATTLHTSGFCATNLTSSGSMSSGYGGSGSSTWQLSLWQSWDCIFQYLLGFSSAGFAVASIASFLLLMLLSMSAGIMVFFIGLYLILQLLTAAFRFIHVYLMAVLALSFVFCLGYLFAPLLLFKNTIKYFTKWVNLLFGYMLTPVLMFAFMGMMLVGLDIAIFSGPYSVYCKIGGSGYCGANAGSSGGSGGGYNLFKDLTSNVIPAETSDTTSGNPNLQDNLFQTWMFAFNGPPSISLVNGASGGGLTLQNTDNGGTLGTDGRIVDSGGGAISGSAYVGQQHAGVQSAGFDLTRLNLSALASGAGSTCTTTTEGSGSASGSGGSGGAVTYFSNCPYLQGVLVSLAVAALLAYIMVSLLSFIPTLASNMTSNVSDSITNNAANFAKSKVFGEDFSNKLLSMGKNSALKAADGAGKTGAASTARKAAGTMSGKR